MKKLYCTLYTIVFMGIGVLTTLIGQYLNGIGFTGDQIGMVTAAGTCVAIFAAPFWGRRYARLTRQPSRFLLLAGVLLCAAAVSLVLRSLSLFPLVLAVYALLYFFQSPAASLMDSLTLDDGMRFGHIRTFGALGFAVACLGAAYLADHLGTETILPAYAFCYVAAAAVVLVLRRQHSSLAAKAGQPLDAEAGSAADAETGLDLDEPADRPGTSFREVYQSLGSIPPYVFLLMCAFFTNGTDAANNTYFSFLYLEGGGTLAGVGVAFLLMAGSEAPFMAASDWLGDRFGQGRILLVALIFSVIRFGLFALGLPAPVLIALFPLQGLVNGIRLVEFVKLVSRLVPEHLRGPGIAVYYALGSSFSGIVCQLIGGHLLESGLFGLTGPQSVYLFFAVFNIAGVVTFIAAGLHRD